MFDEPTSPRVAMLLRRILDDTEAAVGVLDIELRYRYVNPTLARMNGVPAGDHIGRTIAEIVPDIDAGEDVMRRVLKDGCPREIVSSGHTRAESPLERRYWHGAYHRLEAPDGAVLGVVGIILEISAAREQQRALEQARERLALLDAAATRIGTTLDMDTTCGELADFLVSRIADVATVEVFPQTGSTRRPGGGVLRLRRAAMASVPELREAVRRFGPPGSYVDYQPGSTIPRCLETRLPVIENLLADEELGRSAPHPDRVAAYRKLGIHSALVVPLTARDHDVGTVTLIRAGNSPAFGEEDSVVALDLAGRAAISLDNARRYTAEHNAVVELQRAMLAEPGRPHPDVDIAHRYRPAGRRVLVGGDWFEIVALPGGRTLMAVGDVMGHGLEAAVEMSRYQAMLRVAASEDLPPDRVLARMDVLLGQVGVQRPATCVIAIADPADGTCLYASAGHLPPAVVAPDGAVVLVPVPPGPPLGMGFGGYETMAADCRAGHTLLLYTDGLVERRSEDIDASLSRLTGLRLTGRESTEQLLDRLLDDVAPSDAEDDFAVLAARVTRMSPPDGHPRRDPR